MHHTIQLFRRLPGGLVSVSHDSEHWWNWHILDTWRPERTKESSMALSEPWVPQTPEELRDNNLLEKNQNKQTKKVAISLTGKLHTDVQRLHIPRKIWEAPRILAWLTGEVFHLIQTHKQWEKWLVLFFFFSNVHIPTQSYKVYEGYKPKKHGPIKGTN